jgi:hypothetical protein
MGRKNTPEANLGAIQKLFLGRTDKISGEKRKIGLVNDTSVA